MTKEKFEKVKKEILEKKSERFSSNVGRLWGTIERYEDITRDEILELFEMLFQG